MDAECEDCDAEDSSLCCLCDDFYVDDLCDCSCHDYSLS
jgi:hypothetical protein